MEKRKKLHDYSLVMILLAVLGAFNFISTAVGSLIDGTVSDALATVDADILLPVKIVFCVLAAMMVFLALAEAFIGIEGLKISREPDDSKGHIIASKIFLVINGIAVVSLVASLINNEASVVDTVLTLANTVLDIIFYVLFIKAANAVREEYIASK